jgi:Tfp pilus assembly protein PilF
MQMRIPRSNDPRLGHGTSGAVPGAALAVAGVILIVVLVLLVFQDVPDNTFHFDDAHNITENRTARIDTLTLGALKAAATESPLNRRWIPNASFAVDWWRGGGEARTFLTTNLWLHSLAAAAVFLLLNVVVSSTLGGVTRGGIVAAWVGAAMWAVHPINVQAVTLVVQRMTQMACLFSVLCVLFYLLARLSDRPWVKSLFFVGSLLALLLGAASKENAWIVPLLVYLAELGVVRNRKPLFPTVIEKLSVLAMLGFAAITFVVTVAGAGPVYRYLEGAYRTRDFTMVERLLTQPRVVLYHLSQIVWPVPGRFSLEHDFTVSRSLFEPATFGALFVTVAWISVGIWLLCRLGRRTIGFLVLWFPVALLVESSIVGLEMVFEHRMYLPSVGLFGLAALGVAWVAEKTRVPKLASGIVFALILVGMVRSTMSYVPVWRTRMSLSQNSVRVAPSSARAWSDLGKEHAMAGDLDEAEKALRRALSLDPDNRWASEYLGIVMMDRGRLDESERLLRIANTWDPGNPDISNALGEVSFRRELYSEAESFFRHSVTFRPRNPNYRWNLALALQMQAQCSEALTEWREYLEIASDPEGLRRVNEHIQENFLTESGSCYVSGG